jgi:hypothetical protein
LLAELLQDGPVREPLLKLLGLGLARPVEPSGD